MTAGGYGYGYGPVGATDADRETVRSVLQDAHAQGRLTGDEFDSRNTALLNAQTHDQLFALTADLPNGTPAPTQPGYQPAQQDYQQTQSTFDQTQQTVGFQQPAGYQQAGYQQAGYQQPGFQQAGYQQQPGYQQPGYQQPGFQQGYQQMQPGYPQPPFGPYGAQQPTNGLAIAALICGVCQIFFWFVAGIPAIVLGHMARRQIRQTGEGGAGMALAGMILGYAGLALTVLAVIGIAILAAAAAHSGIHNNPFPGGNPLPNQ